MMKLELFGVSTSAYQIEGGWNEDNKGISNWDHFMHKNNTKNNGDIACDDYHRFDETLQLLKELGVNVYRFSIAWTRIQPNGSGKPNAKGLEYYNYIINELNKANISPMVTIFHWDLPQALENEGGWTNRNTVYKYAKYARILFKEFGSKVKYWITHNEPRVVAHRGYGSNTMAPGLNDPSLIPIVNHHLLLSHGLAVKVFREMGLDGEIGISLNLKPIYCFENEHEEQAKQCDIIKNRMYLEPILLGHYPEKLNNESFIENDDMNIISQKIDFLGVNYYSRDIVSTTKTKFKKTNCLGWEVFPQGLYDLLLDLKNKYPSIPPIIITENGYADNINTCSDSKIYDNDRINYIINHVDAVMKAVDKGIQIKGYLLWSLMDNLEWSFGYEPRFGLIHVNFDTLERIKKSSFYAYQLIISIYLYIKK